MSIFSRVQSSPQVSIPQRMIQDQSRFYVLRSPTYIHTLSGTFTISSFISLPFIFNDKQIISNLIVLGTQWIMTTNITKYPHPTAFSYTQRRYPLMMPHISPCKQHYPNPNPFPSYSPSIPGLLQLRVMIDPIAPMPPDSQKALPKMLLRILLCDRVVISKFRPTLTRFQSSSSNTIGGRVVSFESSLLPVIMPLLRKWKIVL